MSSLALTETGRDAAQTALERIKKERGITFLPAALEQDSGLGRMLALSIDLPPRYWSLEFKDPFFDSRPAVWVCAVFKRNGSGQTMSMRKVWAQLEISPDGTDVYDQITRCIDLVEQELKAEAADPGLWVM